MSMDKAMISSSEDANNQRVDEYEKKLKNLSSLVEKYQKESCIQTQKAKTLENSLTAIRTELDQLRDTSFFKNPIQKYKNYKKMLLTYSTLKKRFKYVWKSISTAVRHATYRPIQKILYFGK